MSTAKSLVVAVPPIFSKVVSLFPRHYFRYCFAYGSGVFKQLGKTSSRPMIDMIFVVDDSRGFHGQNIHMNPTHYSNIKRFGHNFIGALQEKWPAHVYFNTLIPVEGEEIVIKYGVISTTHFINDLLDWNDLYIAGRLHKPVLQVEPPSVKRVDEALFINLCSAVHAALLILPEYFTERHFYRTIVALSYDGDFRMIFGEDKNKIDNIVNAQIPYFRELYRPILAALGQYVDVPNEDSVDQTCRQDLGPDSRMHHLFQLPKVPQQGLVREWKRKTLIMSTRRRDTEDVLATIGHTPMQASELLSKVLRHIVFKSSLQQSIKGLFSAGFMKSIKYSNTKIRKMFDSLNKTAPS